MNKDKLKKVIIIFAIIVIGFIGAAFGMYKYNKAEAYNSLITTANKYMDSGEYDKAIAIFNQSLGYKKDINVQRNIKLAQNLKGLTVVYDEGIKLMNDKKYLEAIEQFKKITKEDDKLYGNTKNKIEECKKQYISQNLELANNLAKASKYDDADKYLDEILKIDSNNADAKKLKETFAQAIKNQQEKKENEVKTTSSSNNVTREQAITILNNIGLTQMEIKGKESLIPTEFVVDGENIYGHKCYYIGGVGGNAVLFVLDTNTGKLYESQGRVQDGRRLLKLKY